MLLAVLETTITPNRKKIAFMLTGLPGSCVGRKISAKQRVADGTNLRDYCVVHTHSYLALFEYIFLHFSEIAICYLSKKSYSFCHTPFLYLHISAYLFNFCSS